MNIIFTAMLQFMRSGFVFLKLILEERVVPFAKKKYFFRLGRSKELGYCQDFPFSTNSTELGRAMNRRIDVKVTKK